MATEIIPVAIIFSNTLFFTKCHAAHIIYLIFVNRDYYLLLKYLTYTIPYSTKDYGND